MSQSWTPRVPALIVVLLAAIAMPACRAIEGIFKAGVWVGVIITVLVVAGIIALVSRFR